MYKFFTGAFFLWIAIVPVMASSTEIDHKFILEKINASECKMDAEIIAKEFVGAIERLNAINPKLVSHIRSVSYANSFSLKCDLPNDANRIHWDPETRSIHLRSGAPSNWHTAMGLFHEFLHFVDVEIDFKYHEKFDLANVFEVDYVFACQLAVFPQLADNPALGVELHRIPSARAKCAEAKVFSSEPQSAGL
jgi:hypothetical protein